MLFLSLEILGLLSISLEGDCWRSRLLANSLPCRRVSLQIRKPCSRCLFRLPARALTLTALLASLGVQGAAGGRLLDNGNGNNSLGNTKKIDAIFVFGDSVVDAGTNNFLLNACKSDFVPYGETYFNRPTGRFCNGRLWIDRLAQYLGLPLMQPYLDPATRDYTKGVDFASAGSGFLPTSKNEANGNVANLDQQLQWFSQTKVSLVRSLGAQATEKLLKRSLFIVSAGGVDILWGYANNPDVNQATTPDQFTSIIIDTVYDTTVTLVNQGAKKIVLSAIEIIGCHPGSVEGNNGSCVESVNDMAKLFNSKLPALLERINANCEGVQVVYIDHFDVVEGFIKNGASHGFTKGSHACCGAGDYNGQLGSCGAVDANGTAVYNLCSSEELDQYVFWDHAHPTEKTYGILADLFIHGTGVVKPYNISRLCDCDYRSDTKVTGTCEIERNKSILLLPY